MRTPTIESTLANYGMTPTSGVVAHWKDHSGVTHTFVAPAGACFRCMGVCPGYWSLDSLSRFATNTLRLPAASVWYAVSNGKYVPA